MGINIEVEKIIVKGVQKIEILKLSGLTEEELPAEYTEKGECVYLLRSKKHLFYDSDGKKTVSNHKNDWRGQYLFVGEILRPDTFEECLTNIKRCGKRLAEINKRLRVENKHWNGKVLYNI